ncbi:MAG: hypothetical protein JSV17_06630 [Candidatus Aminicenantes bacterium]|nr:MAG: hypothetical protein JSV17_06630 [Candidatus Aminicenantes bacterium]
MTRPKSVCVFCFIIILFLFCHSIPIPPNTGADSREDREALFEYILAKTLERESFSPIKNRKLQLDVLKEMHKYRDELIQADTDEKLFYALLKISNARKDRHLNISLVKGGIMLPQTAGVSLDRGVGEAEPILHAPIRFSVDYGKPGQYFVFVSDFAKNIKEFTQAVLPEIGDKLSAINGQGILEYRQLIEPYHRYSTIEGFWWKFALWIPQKSYQFPPSFYREKITISLEKKDGRRYDLVLPYLSPEKMEWEGIGEQHYPGFKHLFSTQTYNLYRNTDNKKILLLDWYGFRENLVKDMDRLMDYATEHQLLDYAVIFDGTRSRGGSKGAYAIHRLSPKSFKTTFGNLRLSDIIPTFIDQKRQQYERRRILDSGVAETIDDGTWLMEWLEDDVLKGMHAGQEYSNNVPFKLAHLPKYSDGIINPAKVHFKGPLICWFSPYGGSHLDQFASIIVDNDLGHSIGMPAGGYSNTWEWDEILVFPKSKRPVVRYMWSIGHTIRPNGEILEGNPAKVKEHIPITKENYADYYNILLQKTYEYLGLE